MKTDKDKILVLKAKAHLRTISSLEKYELWLLKNNLIKGRG